MKLKTSITLSDTLRRGMDEHAGEFRSRSAFIESALEHFIRHLERQEAEQKDRDILNRRCDALNAEAADVLAYSHVSTKSMQAVVTGWTVS
jgi:Arc/MetJ-type ribon-helix-helix transcriptional regulator